MNWFSGFWGGGVSSASGVSALSSVPLASGPAPVASSPSQSFALSSNTSSIGVTSSISAPAISSPASSGRGPSMMRILVWTIVGCTVLIMMAGFVLLTIPLSVRAIINNLTHWHMPNIQKYVVRIIWMVPLYSVESWLSLRFKKFSLHIETLRYCYEAYVIYCFLYFLIATFGDENRLISILKSKAPERGAQIWPLNYCMAPWAMGYEFFHICKLGVLQYVVLQNILALIIVVLEGFHLYCEGEFRLDGGYVYICFISSVSQSWALYCLAQFYLATREELQHWRPMGKFLCIKLTIFFTWWQSVMIYIAYSLGIIDRLFDEANWTGGEIAKGLQDYLICIEMFFFAIAFNNYFSHKDYSYPMVHYHEKAEDDEEEWEEDRGVAGMDANKRGALIAKTHAQRKPFLHAFLQSSVPDDVFVDLRRYSSDLSTFRFLPKRKLDEDIESVSSSPGSAAPSARRGSDLDESDVAACENARLISHSGVTSSNVVK